MAEAAKRIEIVETRFAGPLGVSILRYWRGSSHYVNLDAGDGERYVGASTDREIAQLMARRAAGFECVA